MRRTLIIFVAVAAFAIVVVATAPASLASLAVDRASHGVLKLADAEGTLWHGHGTLAAPRSLRLPIAWSIDAWPLARGEWHIHVLSTTAGGAMPRAEITALRDHERLEEGLDRHRPQGAG